MMEGTHKRNQNFSMEALVEEMTLAEEAIQEFTDRWGGTPHVEFLFPKADTGGK